MLFILNAANAQVQVDPNLLNPVAKPGFNLVFEDEFESFDESVWDRSSPGDDNCAYGDDSFCNPDHPQAYNCRVPGNESNVLGSDGNDALVRVREGEDMNLCSHSGGEFKSFDSRPGNPFRDWVIDPNSFLEIRVRYPECYNQGVGCAGWLSGNYVYNGGRYAEIDLWEVYGNEPDQYQANFHWGEAGGGACNTIALIDPNWTYSCQEPTKITVHDLQNQDFNFSEHYLTYGLEWDNDQIKYYLNNQMVKTVALHTAPLKNVYPFHLRLGAGRSLNVEVTECDDFPQVASIDYVRVYKKAGFQAMRLITPQVISICSQPPNSPWDDGDAIKVSYYPGVAYEVILPDCTMPNGQDCFYIDHTNDNNEPDWACQKYWLQARQGTPTGTYTAVVRATYPDGRVEQVSITVLVHNAAPPTPSNLFFTTDSNHFLYTPTTTIQANTLGYEWSYNGGQTWQRQPNGPGEVYNFGKPFHAGPQPITRIVCVRSYNDCGGVSVPFCRTLTIPALNAGLCSGCMEAPLPPREIEVHATSAPDVYQLAVRRTTGAIGYLWSYDAHDWYYVANTENGIYNRYGQFPAGEPPFQMYVRAVFAGETSEIYGQEVSFPAPVQPFSSPGNNEQTLAQGKSSAREQVIATDPAQVSIRVLYDWSGRVISREKISDAGEFQYPYTGIPAGIYIEAWYAEDGGLLHRKKIIVSSNR
ncbi:MAG: family 16 glycosylhydrolase [Saprospiraceae bacterium]|nr:family 16 glycosylhydrolase [Saprospiraceae bacterium]